MKKKTKQTNLGYCRYCISLKKLHECTKSGLSADWVRKSLKIMTVLVLKVGGSFSKLAVSVPVWKYQNGFIWMIDEQLVSLILKVVFQEHKQHLKAQTDFRQCFTKPKPNSGNILLLVVYTSLLIFCKHSSMFSSSTLEDFFFILILILIYVTQLVFLHEISIIVSHGCTCVQHCQEAVVIQSGSFLDSTPVSELAIINSLFSKLTEDMGVSRSPTD